MAIKTAVRPSAATYSWLTPTTPTAGSSATNGGARSSSSTVNTQATNTSSGTKISNSGSGRAGHVDSNVNRQAVSPSPNTRTEVIVGNPTKVVARSTDSTVTSNPATTTSN